MFVHPLQSTRAIFCGGKMLPIDFLRSQTCYQPWQPFHEQLKQELYQDQP